MPKYGVDVSTYNGLGQWFWAHAEGRSVSEVAKVGGIDQKTLYRWLTNPLLRFPPSGVMQAIADGLDKPLLEVQAVAAEHIEGGKEMRLYAKTSAERAILAMLQSLTDDVDAWQQYIQDLVARTVGQADYLSAERRK